MQNEYETADKIQQLYPEGSEKWKEYQEQKDQIEQDYLKKSRDAVVSAEDLKREQYRKTIDTVSQISGQFFDVANQIYDNQLARLEAHYKSEVAMAGDSVEKRIIAERKYEREKAKIMRKQAIAEKAQTVFSIIINTAEAVVANLVNPVLAAIIGALGAAQLATVISTPIPEFAEGIENNPFETFIAGEKGQEAIIKPSGEVELTPDKATLYSDKSYVGSTIIPHDETQKILANYAANHTYDIIDMSESNKLLKSIAKNTRNRVEVLEIKGKTVIKRGYITSTIV